MHSIDKNTISYDEIDCCKKFNVSLSIFNTCNFTKEKNAI